VGGALVRGSSTVPGGLAVGGSPVGGGFTIVELGITVLPAITGTLQAAKTTMATNIATVINLLGIFHLQYSNMTVSFNLASESETVKV
jgi:hypothetical protein